MALFLVLAAGLWALGWMMKTPVQARWLSIGLLYVAMLAVLTVLPETNPLHAAFGGSVGNWLVVGAIGVLVAVYMRGLAWLRRRVRPENAPRELPFEAPAPDPAAPLNDAELDRYARHIVLREVGGPGQMRLKRARVLVIGAGGLGAPVLQYLGAAGVGTLGVIDDDVVDAVNLQRQVIHSEATLGLPKVFSAQKALAALNPHVAVRPYNRRLTTEVAAELVPEYDLVLDGSDNFDTRYLVNRACAAARVPLIAGAITQWEGQLSLYDPARGTPCYECVFPRRPAPGLAPSCAEAGVIGPLPGVVGSMMAMEAVKHITGAGQTLAGRMLLYDALFSENRVIAIKRRTDCPVCGGTG